MMQTTFMDNPYPTRRTPLMAANGVVATSHPLAAQAGLQILQAGGNAIDAAVATAITLTLVEPTSNGIGGDGFALIWDGQQLHGLNAAGRAPAALTPASLAQAGITALVPHGWLAVTVPGAPSGWQAMHAKFGTLPFAQLVQPALTYAEQGHAVAPMVARNWAIGVAMARERTAPMYQGFLPTFAPHGSAPLAGSIYTSSAHARTYRHLAQHGVDAFYRGAIGEAILAFSRATGGFLTADDLANHSATWVEPISISYRGQQVWEIPPSGQGLAALIALGILEGLDVAAHPRDSVQTYHTQIEVMKLAFADAHRYIADPDFAAVPVAGLLSPAYLAQRRALIGPTARTPSAGPPPHGGTVYLCTADREGRMVSMIQSNFWGFGSGVVIPDWGIALHNRGYGFTLDPQHPNVLAAGKRPYHTIIPGFLTRAGQAIGPFGVMGGPMQPQGHMQVVANMYDYGLHVQAALDAPRWRVGEGAVYVEPETPRHILAGLEARGHQLVIETEPYGFGRGQIIQRLASGAYIAGSESRCDGAAVGW
ncbi:MAG: gamma-glutamyltransferase family protein [Chloroflexaceae bacterium]|nr:gamma-glutamyltransferase family protein [Chloroflexaceae bacterium]